ncbi:NnrS family protein [Ruficoccus amylovorans]|uniref:NnrS family protein n=1 Tax=Ruficoccus amylovorans TaxID=1804625 RepID=A0A842HAB7_9BACT|nr:NnrS family protein [Ruficoccus amylovorans]MBC2593038.1 NnrS family protein [Ruficoccus amylovorans]
MKALPMPTVPEPARCGFWRLVAEGEPYRLLFAVGTLLGVFGVSLWPAYAWGLVDGYPGQTHARIMIEGFLSCFVVGFLGTAFPRLLEVRRFSLEESLTWAGIFTGASACHVMGKHLWGDYVFTLGMTLLLGSLWVRFRSRRDTPPPGFVLVLLGMLCALSGGATLVVQQLAPDRVGAVTVLFFKTALNQGYLLLPVMGIGAFLIPRFFGLPNRQDFPESLKLPRGWIPRALFALLCGGLVLTSFYLEAIGEQRFGFGLRAFAVVLYFYRELPLHQAKFNQGALALAMRVALFSIPLGYAAMALWPARQAALIHVVFISGFSLLTFTVATRVALGHSGRSHLFKARLVPVYLLGGLLVLAMTTRVSADWLPLSRMNHIGYAAIVWMVGVGIWLCRFGPCLRDDVEREQKM